MKNASMGRPVAARESPANPHGYSFLTGHVTWIFGMLVVAVGAAAPPKKIEFLVLPKQPKNTREMAKTRMDASFHGAAQFANSVLLSGMFAVAGCATAPPAPPQKVEVPVLVSCIDPAKVPLAPVFKFSALAPAATGGDKVLALGDDWLTGRAYEGQLEAAIAGCR